MHDTPADAPQNERRTQILDAAEMLFIKRGFSGVTLRDIGAAVGIHHASLYYYAAGGKVQLFTEVIERSFERHRIGLGDAVASAGDLRAQLHAAARWLIAQPAMNLEHMADADSDAIGRDQVLHLMEVGYNAVREPIVHALYEARRRGEIGRVDLSLAAMAFVSLVTSVPTTPEYFPQASREATALKLVDLLLDGLVKR